MLVAGIAAAVVLLRVAVPAVTDLVGAGVNSIGIVGAFYYALTGAAAAVRLRHLLREAPPQAIGEAQVERTSVGGRLVHASA